MTIRLTEQDMECVEKLKQDFGCASTLAAIRLALRAAQRERFPPAGTVTHWGGPL
jgi:hypothetical protein